MRTLVVAPHPDDELLGCGGLLLRRHSEGARVGLVIVTSLALKSPHNDDEIKRRQLEIGEVAQGLGISSNDVFQLGFPTTTLDAIPMFQLVQAMSSIFQEFVPNEILTPHRGDVHSDHRITSEVVAACSKWFRYPSIRRVLSYETLSETGLGHSPELVFNPNVYVDISPWIERKIELLEIYSSEMAAFPFPRSAVAVRALAQLRGANSGFAMAEAFELLLDRI
jgi:LmbE family N-acetylglucosaminyl deacetylase